MTEKEKLDLIEAALNRFGRLMCECRRPVNWDDFWDRADIVEWLKRKGTTDADGRDS